MGENRDIRDRDSSIKLPSSYLSESAILSETEETMLRLRELLGIFERLVEFRRSAEIELPFNPVDFRRTVDSPDLQEILARLNSLASDLPQIESVDVPEHRRPAPHIAIIKSVRPILRGYLETTEVRPIFDRVLLYISFIPIHKERDKLERDHHDFVGWHYHYCNAKGRRSDTMLSFDLYQSDRIDAKTKKPMPRVDNTPLFWERHAETDAVFSSNADAWGTRKRSNIMTATKPDLIKKKFANFRHPAKAAKPVWPLGVVLSDPLKVI